MDINKRDYTGYIDLLPSQFENADNLKKFLSIFLNESQEFFDELYKLFETGLDLDLATGYQLDILGKLENVYRGGRNDEDYRQAIRSTRFIAGVSGTIPELIEFLRIVTNSDVAYIHEVYPASICGEVTTTDLVTSNTVEEADKVSMAGVNFHSLIHSPNGIAVRPISVKDVNNNKIDGKFQPLSDTDKGFFGTLPSLYEYSTIDPSDRLAGRSDMIAGFSTAQAKDDDIKQTLYNISSSIASRSYMSAGNPRALATGLSLRDPDLKKGRLPEVYTRENK